MFQVRSSRCSLLLGMLLTVVFFAGCPHQPVIIPDVVGMTQEAAEAELVAHGFWLGAVTYQCHPTVAAGYVIRQWPEKAAAGEPRSLPVDIWVSLGPEASFAPGVDVEVDSRTIGEAGGTLEGPLNTPISGVQVTFPPGALPDDTEVTIGYNTGTTTTVAGQANAAALVVETPGVSEFSQPVEITIGLPQVKSGNVVPVPYHIDENGDLHVAQLIDIDRANGTATFVTFHASLFTWILELISGAGEDSYTTGFRPEDDGFQIVNAGSTYNRDGECFGMTSFALWYFENHADDGDFFDRFMNEVGQDAYGIPWTGQNLIATRAFTSIAQQWSVYWPDIRHESGLTDEDNFAIIKNALANTDNPVLIYLYRTGTTGSASHSVLAYAYAEDCISIYDPNVPGVSRIIEYDSDIASFNTYNNFDGVLYNGDGSLNLTEPYTEILADAEQDFHDNADAVINITSHTNGQETTARNITLTGTIESGPVAVTQLEVFIGSTSFKTDVGYSGAFSMNLPIQVGNNHLLFNTRGVDADGNLIRTPLPNNMRTVDFVITGIFDYSVILTTLTWDKDDTDLDTYVIDPTGDYSCYYHMDTADGGELDIDDINGFGPEHWTLSASDIVRYDQDYHMRVHYYSDHGNGATNYTVSITLYEGTDRELNASFRGNLSVCSTTNKAPNATGADWANIATIRPANAKGLTMDEIFSRQEDGTLLITVPVESYDK